MSLILNGTDGLSDVDGTAATPAIRGTDANTGIFFPAADTIAFAEGGAEVVRIDSAGNVGIGTSSPSYKLQVQGAGQTDAYIYNSSNAVALRLIASTTAAYVQTQTNHPIYFAINNGATAATIETNGDFKFNSGYGSAATAYGCRAWVNFNGTGTVAIRASGNVSSITDNGTGDYTVNFTTAMPDVNYSLSGGASRGSGDTSTNGPFAVGIFQATTPATGSVRIQTGYGGSQASAGSNQDAVYVCVAIHR